MNRLTIKRRVAIVHSLVDGASIRTACRAHGVAKGTVHKLLAEMGTACADYQNRHFVQLQCKHIQVDEIWSFIRAKEKNVHLTDRGNGRGDIWTWTAICADTKLIPCWHVGVRDADAALAFLEDLASRLANRVQLTTDAHHAYLSATERAFGWNGADYAMLLKLYGNSSGAGRYGPPEVVGIEKRVTMGKPDAAHISTSYAERSNLTMRMSMARFARLTNAFSKKLENHMQAVSLHFMNYNFCRPHQTLTKAARGIHTTPAIVAGLTNRVWQLDDIVQLTDTPSN